MSREHKKRFRDEVPSTCIEVNLFDILTRLLFDQMANYDGPATTVADDESKTKKKRQKKDPNAPKKAMTSYLAYSNEQRPLIKQEQPSLSMTEISKVIGQRWKALSSEEQEVCISVKDVRSPSITHLCSLALQADCQAR